MMKVTEFLYHALGICGEHSHPNLINILFLGAVVYVIYKYLIRENIRIKED